MATPAADLLDEFDFGDNVDQATFEQILDMDDEDDEGNAFSHSIVFGYFEQAETTFENMDKAVDETNLQELSNLGHFLKGSSATLGFTKVKDECEKIQHFGAGKDEAGIKDEPDAKLCLRLTVDSISKAKAHFKTVKALMTDYYAKLES